MTPEDFVKTLLPFAIECEKETGIRADVILAQAALESGWGKHAPGNMYFGVKDIDGVNGNEQLLTTFEFSTRADRTAVQVGLVYIASVAPAIIEGKQFFKYVGKAYFRKYSTPKDCFVDHAKLFLRAKVYANALAVKESPEKFIDEMAKYYASAPNYAILLKSLLRTVKKFIS